MGRLGSRKWRGNSSGGHCSEIREPQHQATSEGGEGEAGKTEREGSEKGRGNTQGRRNSALIQGAHSYAPQEGSPTLGEPHTGPRFVLLPGSVGTAAGHQVSGQQGALGCYAAWTLQRRRPGEVSAGRGCGHSSWLAAGEPLLGFLGQASRIRVCSCSVPAGPSRARRDGGSRRFTAPSQAPSPQLGETESATPAPCDLGCLLTLPEPLFPPA